MIKSMLSAFLMYSKIPVPQVEWKEENRRYSLCFFPLIGVVIGAVEILWRLICNFLGFGQLLFSAVSVVIPILITGGIHLDGFCDVSDAMASYGDFEKRLEIMKDSHVGAFAVIKICMYFLIYTALMLEVSTLNEMIIVSAGYVISRSLSGISAVIFKSAKKTGTLQSFVQPAHKRITVTVLIIWIVACVVFAVYMGKLSGAVSIILAFAMLFYYRNFAYRNFGGVTGDLSGWFLSMCEIVFVFGIVVTERIGVVL